MPATDGISSILVYFEIMMQHISLVYYVTIYITMFFFYLSNLPLQATSSGQEVLIIHQKDFWSFLN